MTPDRRTLLALFALAFGLRILYAVILGDPIAGALDSYGYRIASRMVESWEWISTPFSPSAPGYRMLLAAAFKIFGVSWWTAVLLNAVLGAVTTLFVYRIGERLLGKRVGLVSALWLGLSVGQMYFASLVTRDVLVVFLLTWLAYALARPFYRMRTATWTAFLCTLLLHSEPMFLVLLPLLVVFLALKSTHHRALSAQYVFLFLAALFVFFLPWTMRNWFVYRDVVPVGLEATRYTAPVARLLRDLPPEPSAAAHPGATTFEKPGFFQNQREFWRVVRLTDAPADPARGRPTEPAWSLRHNAASALSYGLLLPFFLVGLVYAVARRHRAALVLGSIVVAYALLRGFLWTNDYSRLWVEPLIILVAFYGVRVLLDLRRAAGEPDAST
ncbi:MAG TPA: glycosyltransferase family 39 protein [Candidatus Krumholzibacteria bacterium]|nr:glycosyltransferase family 39 protein [Candidatus Krumholzibacteria bacterium]